MRRSHHNELRLLLTFFYIYLNCYTLIYVKQMVFHYAFLSSPFKHPYTYIHIRAIAGGSVSFIYRFLLIYALWRKMTDLCLISIAFLAILIFLRLIFDFYGYFSGYIKQSLYYPFESFNTKSMKEEITDSVFALTRNSIGLILSIYMFTDIVNGKRPERIKETTFNHQLSIFE